MRLYVYEPGPTAYISAEFVMPDRMWREIQAAGLSGKGESVTPPVSEVGELLTREQLLADPKRRLVLQAWESGNDTAFLAARAARSPVRLV